MSGAFSPDVPDHVVTEGARLPELKEDEKEVGQGHVQATLVSKKPRQSVQEMLLQNMALPISPTNEDLLSDMCIRVCPAPNPSGSQTTLMEQGQEVAGTGLGVGQASGEGMQGQQGLQELGEPKPKESLTAGRAREQPGQASPKLASSAKSITAASSKPHRSKHSKHRHAADKNPDQRRKQVLYKPSGGLVPANIDAPHTSVPPKTENLRVEGAADSTSAAQEHIPEPMEAQRRRVGQANETPSKRSSKSMESARRASTTHILASHVEEKPQGRTVIGTEVPRAISSGQEVHPARVALTANAKAEKEAKQKHKNKEKKQKKGKSRGVPPS
nr:uncharacterized protein LOC126524326 [Dermacentor andersoni]